MHFQFEIVAKNWLHPMVWICQRLSIRLVIPLEIFGFTLQNES